jgi:hypothetical protein
MKDNPLLFTLCIIAALLLIGTVSAENVYRDNNPALQIPDPASHGYAIFMIRCGGSAMDTTILYRNLNYQQNLALPGTGWINITNNLTSDGWGFAKVLPDGRSDIIPFAAGHYEACIRDGNGGQPECQQFTIGGGATETVGFNGHAVSSPRRPKPTPPQPPVTKDEGSIEVISTPAGGSIYLDDTDTGKVTDHTFDNQTAGNHKIEVTLAGYYPEHKSVAVKSGEKVSAIFTLIKISDCYQPEINHTIYHPEVNHTEYFPEVNHTEYFPEVNHTIYNPEVNHTVYYPEIPKIPAWEEIIVDKEAYTGTIIDVPEHTDIIVDAPAYEGLIIDTPSWDEIIVDTPSWDETISHQEINHTTYHSETNFTAYHAEINHTEYSPEVNHTVYHQEINHTAYHPEANHTLHYLEIPAVPAWIEHFGAYEKVHGHYTFVGQGNGDYVKNGSKYNYVKPVYHPEIPAIPAWEEIVIDTPAWMELIIDQEAYTETIIDVPEHTDLIVDSPAWEEIIVIIPAWEEIIVDVPAWEETIPHPEINHTIYYPEVNHTVYHAEVNHTEHFPEINHTVYHQEINHTIQYPEIPAIPAWEEIVIDTPAREEFIIDHEAYEVIVIETPAEEKIIIDIAARTEIIIDTPTSNICPDTIFAPSVG